MCFSFSIRLVEAFFIFSAELIAEIGMGDLNQRACALTEGPAGQLRDAVRRDHIVHVIAGCGHASSTGTILEALPLTVDGMAMMERPFLLMAAPRTKST